MAIPQGLCQCGCGQRTRNAPQTIKKLGWVKGEPTRYINGHNNRKSAVAYVAEDRGFETPCWVWQWTLSRYGHGQRMVGRGASRRSVYAHRHEWERVNGPVPGGRELHHRCEVPSCVNPSHLQLVTRTQHRRAHSPLTPNDVRKIRKRAAAGERQGDIGADYGVTQAYISLIVTRRQWADVT